ncbi:MAG: acireductone synthase, partial [Shewanella sp.]
LNTISLSPRQVLFVSDVLEELKAADAAGMMTCQMVRDSTQRTGDFRTISSFDELIIE